MDWLWAATHIISPIDIHKTITKMKNPLLMNRSKNVYIKKGDSNSFATAVV